MIISETDLPVALPPGYLDVAELTFVPVHLRLVELLELGLGEIPDAHQRPSALL